MANDVDVVLVSQDSSLLDISTITATTTTTIATITIATMTKITNTTMTCSSNTISSSSFDIEDNVITIIDNDDDKNDGKDHINCMCIWRRIALIIIDHIFCHHY